MKKLLTALIIFILLAGTAAAQVKEITIINNTEYPVKEIYASPSTSDDWGENFLKNGQVLEWGGKFVIKVDISNEYYFDFKLVDTDDDYYKKWEVDLSAISSLEFVFDDYTDDEDYYDDDYYGDDYYDDDYYGDDYYDDDYYGDDYYDDDYYGDDYYYDDYYTGYDDGYAAGFRDGFKEAYSEAFQAGYQAALEAMQGQ